MGKTSLPPLPATEATKAGKGRAGMTLGRELKRRALTTNDRRHPFGLRGIRVACRFGNNGTQENTDKAWLEPRGKLFPLVFRIGGRKFPKSLKTANPNDATSLARRIERRLALIEQGDVLIPPDADLMTVLLVDGKLKRPVRLTRSIRRHPVPTTG